MWYKVNGVDSLRSLNDPITLLTDAEIEQRLEQLTFTIALDTMHFNAFDAHKRLRLQKDLLVNKQALRSLREERERRILAGHYNPW
jgi:hypothetical protein